jgi:hypothetical protein
LIAHVISINGNYIWNQKNSHVEHLEKGILAGRLDEEVING